MTTPVLLPLAPLVAIAYLKSLSDVSYYVAPADITQGIKHARDWARDFSITVATVVPSSNPSAPIQSPVVQVNVWGKPRPGETKLPHNIVESISMLIEQHTYSAASPGWFAIGGGTYSAAKITDVSIARGSQRNRSATAFAACSLDLRFTYVYQEGN